MTEPPHEPKPTQNLPPSSKISSEIGSGSGQSTSGPRYPNPPESGNPDAATLREQWRFAIRQYSKWYSHAWGTAILAGVSFFALGWIVKGSNPLPSFKPSDNNDDKNSTTSSSNGVAATEGRQSR